MSIASLNAPVGFADPMVPSLHDETDRSASRIFIHANMVSCLLLQRFCVIVGGGVLFWCLPVFMVSLLWMLATGRARLRPFALWSYGAFVVIALISTLISANTVDGRIAGLSLPSLASVLILYVGLVAAPSSRFMGETLLDIFIAYARFLAVCGIVQYLAQFAGFSFFAFGDVAPALRPILAEAYFNSHPVVAYGSPIMRANGVFLLEPSIFSQVLMLAVVVDVFLRGRWLFLPLYGLAYVMSYSGTGLLALVVAGGLAIVLAPRNSLRLVVLGLVGMIVAIFAAIILPDAFASLLGRSAELNYSGSSGYARYLGQLKLLDEFAGETRTIIGFGPGTLERTNITVAGSTNAALKLFFEYGVLGLGAFATFLIGTLWRRDLAIVSLNVLVNYQLGGGYLLTMPIVILAALMCIWSGPVRTEPAPALAL